ncbi:hypothetical protein [Pigmentiphaga litoralis]|uniref:Uncharacterized protein n=1 Tax=Pigmentiphaga litoralis TaxID=516702 RepID=A0A7Y9IUL2_9BURK|nr:hypothetical protein [Pigmentiphaga litoralis]NYE23025.1 hypothetical protein [Pigmentiphaga litoralis]NYE83360.1 hypothetical protein [Pigmentiphaga litoralis]
MADPPGAAPRAKAAKVVCDASAAAANDADHIAIRTVVVKIAPCIAGFDTVRQRDVVSVAVSF